MGRLSYPRLPRRLPRRRRTRHTSNERFPSPVTNAFRLMLLSDHVRRVPVVLFADALDEIGIRQQAPGELDRPRLRIRLRIVDGDFDIHVADLRPRETFGDAQGFGPWQSPHVEPGLAVLLDRLHDERVLV